MFTLRVMYILRVFNYLGTYDLTIGVRNKNGAVLHILNWIRYLFFIDLLGFFVSFVTVIGCFFL